MTEKTLITPDQIQAGDLIRFEWDEPAEGDPVYGSHAQWAASEYRATKDGSTGGFQLDDGKYYLIHRPVRPESPVQTTDTLGWLHRGGELLLGVWRTHDYKFTLDDVGRAAIQWEREIPVDQVTGFTPAIAVPAELSEDLVNWIVKSIPMSALQDRAGAVRAVLFALLENAQDVQEVNR